MGDNSPGWEMSGKWRKGQKSWELIVNRQEESRCEETAGHSPENALEIYWASRIRIICADPDLDPYPDLSINKQKGKKNLDFHYFLRRKKLIFVGIWQPLTKKQEQDPKPDQNP